MQQSKLEFRKALLTIPRLSQKQVKQSLFHMSNKLFLPPWKTAWEHERSFIMTPWLHIALRFPITGGASVAISASDELPFVSAVTSGQARNA